MNIYVVLKVAMEKNGEHSFNTVEKAYQNPEDAKNYLKTTPIVWEETINGVECNCERGVCEIALE